MSQPRILFFGYSEVGHDCLELLVKRGHNVVALITHENQAGENIWFKTPALIAKAHGIPVLTPESVKSAEWVERIREMQPDLILSVYYRHMIPEAILRLAPLGAFNLHGSLLPKYRGRAPINWAVLHGESRIGMSLHRMVKRPDAGEVVDQEGVEIGPDDTAEEAFRKVLPCATEVLGRQIDHLLAGTATGTPQNEAEATYYGGRTPEDGRINWALSSEKVHNLVRAVTDPYPGAFTDFAGARLMVWQTKALPGHWGEPGEIFSLEPLTIATGDGAVQLLRSEWRGQPTRGLAAGDIL
ncbi:formyltransferase [Haloferula sp. BvORR071]|uniref:formyltransferase n=1 Tax=Haloferula sp. BvORR071 TaxID=1396141 RepID=UPI00094653D2|nr:formyltransferase [Haloferula sp. BvORR071]